MNNEQRIDLTAALTREPRPNKRPDLKYIKDHAEDVGAKLQMYAETLVEFLEDGHDYAAAIQETNDRFDIYLLAERLNAPKPKRRPVTKNSVEYFVRKYRAVDAASYVRDLVPLLDFYKSYEKATSHLNAELSDPEYMWKKMGIERPVESQLDKNLRKIANNFK